MTQTKVEAPFVENNKPFRNFIINGDMEIWQRAIAATTVSDGSYSACDRWHFPFYSTDGAMTTERETLSDADQAATGMYYCNLLKCTTADTSVAAASIVQMRQTIEAQFCQPFKYGTSAAKTLTLSFYAKANASKTYGVNLWKRDSTSYYWFQDIAVTTSWQRFEIVISPTAGSTSLITGSGGDIANDNGEGIEVNFVLVSGSNYQATADTWTANQDFNTSNLDNFLSSTDNTFRVTGVQLEIGNQATDFEHVPHDVQMQRCQRYYESNYDYESGVYPAEDQNYGGLAVTLQGHGYAADNMRHFVYFKVRKRGIPSITYYRVDGLADGSAAGRWDWYDGGWDQMSGATTVGEATETGLDVNMIDTDISATNSHLIGGGWEADSEL